MATRTKKYVAEHKDLDHLLQIIEDEMGPDAQLEVTEYRQGGLLGVGGKRMIEITATVKVSLGGVGRATRQTIRLGDDWTKPTPAEEGGRTSIRADVPIGAPIQPRRESEPAAATMQASAEATESATQQEQVAERRAEADAFRAAHTEHETTPAHEATPAPPAAEEAAPVEETKSTSMGARIHTLKAAEQSPIVSVKPKRSGPKTPAARALGASASTSSAPAVARAATPPAAPTQQTPPVPPVTPPPVEAPAPGMPAESVASMATAAPSEVGHETQAAVPPAGSKPQDSFEPIPDKYSAPEPAAGDYEDFEVDVEPEPAATAPQHDLESMLEQLSDAPADLGALQSNLDEIKQSLERMIPSADTQPAEVAAPPALTPQPVSTQDSELAAIQREVYDQLVDWNVRSADALALIEASLEHYSQSPEPTVRGLLTVVASEMLRPLRSTQGILLQPGQKRVVAVVGTTGTGKTSTVAKLAAHFAFERGARVAIISLDTYRIAAVEQLRTYAEIMGFPLSAAFSPDDYAEAVAAADADLVLVDTAGRSPLNRKQLDDLRRTLVVRPDEVHLTLPATSRADEVRLALAAFEDVGVDRVIVTKLDETLSLGMLYNLSQLSEAPISYYGTGQAIPEDLHPAMQGFIRGWAETLELV